jgi:Lipopolysaccharide biosynthesis proteins, LPS:glycosyltransferases
MHIADRISILVASDNHYSVLIGALIKSIDTHHKTGEAIDFYIIDDHISGSNKEKIVKTADPARINIRWIEISRLAPYISQLPLDKSSFPTTIYYRIFAPHLIDAAAKKLIYLDVDTIVRTDISNLWNVNLASHALAAVQDIGKTVTSRWGGIPNYTELGLSPDTKYFNSGVLLIDVDKWRKQHISTSIIDVLVKYREHVVLPDQYGLNVVFANNWLELAPAWNWSAAADHDDPHLVHFLHIKPIFKSCYSNERWKKEFFDHLNQTPWKNFRPISEYKRKLRLGYNRAKKLLRL